jgi:carbon-monoxide dehydrogenase medium subunit
LLEWRRGAIDLDYCIDLSALQDLGAIQFEEWGVRIGALATVASIYAHRQLDDGFAILREVAGQFATPQIRNTATIGGNLCHAVPSADFAIPLLALDAEVKLRGLEGERTMLVEAFFVDVKRTALSGDEMLLEIHIPKPPPRTACAFERVTRSSVDIALVNAAVRITTNAVDAVQEARVVLGAVAPVPFRAKRAEEVLVGKGISELDQELQAQVAQLAAAETCPITDVRTNAAYRKYVSQVLVRRTLSSVLDKLRGG